MAYTPAYAATVLDANHSSDYIAYSTNGTSECSIMVRTLPTWNAAVAKGGPGEPQANKTHAAFQTANATGNGTITHINRSASASGGTLKDVWEQLTTPRAVTTGNPISFAAGAIVMELS